MSRHPDNESSRHRTKSDMQHYQTLCADSGVLLTEEISQVKCSVQPMDWLPGAQSQTHGRVSPLIAPCTPGFNVGSAEVRLDLRNFGPRKGPPSECQRC